MKRKSFLALLLSVCVFLPAFAQQKRSDDKDDDVVRITTNLVQVDAVVTKDGKVVPNLTADDFEIYEDGRKQTITSFAYISNVAGAPAPRPVKGATVVPYTPFKPDEPHRTIAFVVDDLGLSAESMHQVKRQLRKFLNEGLQPNDLVAVMRTGSELGALQQLTTDKRLLSRAVEQLRWTPCSRMGVSVFRPAGSFDIEGCPTASVGNTLRSLRFIIESMGQLPGRKSLVLLSDFIPRESQNELFAPIGRASDDDDLQNASAMMDSTYVNYSEALNKLAEKAVRASVVIYGVDTQGLAVTGITAADSFSGNYQAITQQMNRLLSTRSNLLFTRREGAQLLAQQTGGLHIRNSNDFQLNRIVDDQSGYYLLGYRPSDETFNKRFHHIKARVKRSGMSLRTRFGFFGLTEEEATRGKLTPTDLTNLALVSPFSAQDIEIDLTPFFADHSGENSLIRSFVNLGLKDLTFSKVNDLHQASIEIHAVAFGDNGRVAQQFKNGATLHFTDAEYQQALQNGFEISVDLPVKRPGSYQVRVAVRDRNSSKIGSAGGYVDVPNLKKKQIATSGIVLGRVSEAGLQAAGHVVTNPGVRRFKANSELSFAYRIYNSAIEGSSQLRDLVMQARLFRDGKEVFSIPESPIGVRGQQDPNQVIANGVMPLSPNLEPDRYYLQVVITEKRIKDKPVSVAQWIDFEIVK